ncbi:hypothetical protein J6590_055381 [Homalodisca vitripennis]|nr:hypothetical protein J6590_055381 [Homalodisca vitripennis]
MNTRVSDSQIGSHTEPLCRRRRRAAPRRAVSRDILVRTVASPGSSFSTHPVHGPHRTTDRAHRPCTPGLTCIGVVETHRQARRKRSLMNKGLIRGSRGSALAGVDGKLALHLRYGSHLL